MQKEAYFEVDDLNFTASHLQMQNKSRQQLSLKVENAKSEMIRNENNPSMMTNYKKMYKDIY